LAVMLLVIILVGMVAFASSAAAAPKVYTEPNIQIGYFNTNEFRCRGSGEIKVRAELIDRLNEMREYLGRPIIVTSGYRAPWYNAQINGSPTSRHMTGKAVDIRSPGVSIHRMRQIAEKFFGDGGISSYRKHVHVDIGPRRRW